MPRRFSLESAEIYQLHIQIASLLVRDLLILVIFLVLQLLAVDALPDECGRVASMHHPVDVGALIRAQVEIAS